MEYLVLLAAAIAALVYVAQWVVRRVRDLWRWGRNLARVLHAVHELVDRELTNNHGSSMKDDVDGLAVAVGAMSRLVDDLDERLTSHLNDRSDP